MAVATPIGRGGIGVVRVSGPEALAVVDPVLRLRRKLAAGRTRFGEAIDPATGAVLDEVIATYFQGPRSYTGEDVVEIAVHGSPVVLEALLRACCAGGARLARAGEFTERAFLAGRLDLTQAEAVADLIEANTLEQARAAARQLGGAVARETAPVKERLVALIAELEAGIDFAEDDIAVMPAGTILAAVDAIAGPLARMERSFGFGRVLREGFTLALVGRPNAGKSSLFNCLLERERAIVTATPGTTRDTVTERMAIDGVPVELVDTAGLRATSAELDEAERLGIARSREAMAEASVVVLVLEASAPLSDEDQKIVAVCEGRPLVIVRNKVDLVGERKTGGTASAVWTSALTGEGVAELRMAILQLLGGTGEQQGTMVTNLRQQQAVAGAIEGLRAARTAVQAQMPHEMLLLDLYGALHGLDELTGETTAEEVLRLIFGRFCIGK